MVSGELPLIVHPLPLSLLGGLGVLSGSALDDPNHMPRPPRRGIFLTADCLSVANPRSFPVASV